MSRSLSLLAVLLLSFAFFACGGDANIALSDFGPQVLDIACTRGVNCGQYPDKATCTSLNRADLVQLEADVSSGKTKYDGAAAATCLKAARSAASATCSFSRQASEPSVPVCAQIFTGTIADGSPCFAPEECVSASCDLGACGGAMCCAGICSPTVTARVPIGGDCTAPAARCGDGAYCTYVANGSTPPGRCAALIAVGQPCGFSNGVLCVSGAFCLGTPGRDGVCGRAPAEGEACDLTPCDLQTNFCDDTMKCAPKIPVGGACPSGGGCVDYANCSAGSCVDRPVAGGACDDATGSYCLGPLQCTAGTCVVRPAPTACL